MDKDPHAIATLRANHKISYDKNCANSAITFGEDVNTFLDKVELRTKGRTASASEVLDCYTIRGDVDHVHASPPVKVSRWPIAMVERTTWPTTI